MELKVELTKHDSVSSQRREVVTNPSNLRGNVKIINSIEVGPMHEPMPWNQPSAAHVNIPSLTSPLAFYLFASTVMSPSTQVLANAVR